MSVEEVVLRSAMRFARDRLSRLADRGLLAILGVDAASSADLVTAVEDDLRRAASDTGLIDPDGDIAAAVGHAAAAISAVHAACREITAVAPRVGTAEQALASAVTSLTGEVGGLAGRLGLAVAGHWSAAENVLAVEFRDGAPVDLGGLVTVTGAVLAVRYDWKVGHLRMTLTGDVVVRLGVDPLVEVLAGGRADVPTRVSVSIDSDSGASVGGGALKRTRLTGAVDSAVVALRDLAIAVAETSIDITAVLAGTFGPIEVVVRGAGARLVVGPDRIAAEAAEPVGAGVSVNTGVVRGGGDLTYRDGGYSGDLALTVGPVQAKAYGIIATRPDFSLLLLLFSEFGAPIQLGFGFTLDGVGGLLAVERTVSSDALLSAVRDGTADALLFPDNRGVDRGLLENVFPAARGTIAVGPAFRIGWGTPVSLLTAEFGLVLVLPDPRVMVLGALRIAVPSPVLPIVDIRASVVGEVTPERVLVLVSLEGSRLAGFSLSGELGLLFGYGAQPRFAISAGGFHPGYQAPPELSSMRRLAVDISPPALLSLRAEAYFAVTSNAIMLGARVEAHIDFVVAEAHGHLVFDALVMWAPFHFEVDIRAGISIKIAGETFAGIALALHLEGPGRWVAHGTATLELFFLPDIDLEVGPLVWGTRPDDSPPAVSPLQLLRDELAKPASWLVLPPEGVERLVSFRDGTPVADTLLAHPLGGVGVKQRAVPLNVRITQVGGRPVTEHQLGLGALTVAHGAPPARQEALTDLFAPGHFFTLTEDQRLSRPAFAPYECGVTATGFTTMPIGPHRETEYGWETAYPHHPRWRSSSPEEATSLASSIIPHVLAVSPVGRYRATEVGNPYRVAGEAIEVR